MTFFFTFYNFERFLEIKKKRLKRHFVSKKYYSRDDNDVLLLLDATSSPKQQEQRGASFPRVSFNFSCRGISRGRRCRRWGRPAAAAATVIGSCLVNEPFSFFFVREVIDVIKPTARFVVVGDEERGRGRRRRKF